MPGIPKIVVERLRAKFAAASSGAAPGPPSFQGAEHPDANLLAAFVEQTLTARERAEVIDHLALCAACREVVALALPEEVEVAEPVQLPARRRSVWSVLRWSAVAAALGAVAIVVVVHEYPSRRQAAVSTEMRPVAGPGEGALRTSAKLPAPQPNTEAVAKTETESRGSAREMAKLEAEAGRSPGRNVAPQPAGAEAHQQETLMVAARPPAPPVPAEREASRTGVALSVGAMPTPPPPAKPAFKLSAPPQGEPQAEAGRAVANLRTESATASSDLNTYQALGASRKATTAATARAATHLKSGPSAGEFAPVAMAARSESKSKPGPPSALWTISASGKIERSVDGAKTWQEVPVDDAVTFRVVTASEGDVWAGGSGGALYHSSDGGANWQRIYLEPGGSAVAQAIVGIRIHDLQHLAVTTASGEQWVSEDGGQHWQREQ